MSLTINTNLDSLAAQRAARANDALLAVSMQRLSSGLRVNSAADDAAGLAIGARMESQVRGGDVAVRNLNDGISLLQTADSVFSSVADAFQRMRELAVQASNASNASADVVSLETEYGELYSEVDRLISAIQFNGIALSGGGGPLGTGGASFTFQVGPNVADTISTTLFKGHQPARPPSPLTGARAATSVRYLDAGLDTVNAIRANAGAMLNRFSSAVGNLQDGGQAQAAARSRIVDADYASETAQLSRSLILQQAGIAMVAQANQRPRNVMSLLKP
jgi:flagellin